jgi:integrase
MSAGKKQGPHREKVLTAVQVRALKAPGKYADGNGLYLVVDPSGAKRWLLRIVVQGRRRDLGLGGLALVSLAEAREQALSYRKRAREGGNPLVDRKIARKPEATVMSFAQAAEQVYVDHCPTWKSKKHATQWITTLRTYANPFLGAQPVDRVATSDILRALSPIWLAKPETARRVRQRISTVLDWAKAAGHRSGDNPVEGVERGLPKQGARNQHHAAMHYAEVPAFVTRLQSFQQSEITRLALEFLILTAARTGEVLGAEWREIDEAELLWTVPAERMKAGREHRAPLSRRAVRVLQQAKELAPDNDLIFPGRALGRPLSNMVFLLALQRMGVSTTPHGFRSSFRDWAAEATNLPREVAEMALAHAIENKVEAAYRRGGLHEKRREMMELWATFLNKE